MKNAAFVSLSLILGGCAVGTTASSPGSRPSRAAVAVRDGEEAGRVPPSRVEAGLFLDRAIAIAEAGHPDIAVARARVEAAAGRAIQAGAHPNPLGVVRMESAPFGGRALDEAEYVAGVSFPIDLGGQASAARRAEEIERDRLALESEALAREVRARVRSAFATALYAERAVEVQRSSVEMGQKGVAVTRSLLAAGEAIPEDLARAELDLAHLGMELERARSLREEAFRRLAAAMGDPALGIESLAGSLEAALDLPALESVLERVGEHPRVKAAEAAADAYRARIVVAEAQRIPRVSLDLFYRRLQDSRENAFDAGFSVPLPIFDGGQGRLREARAEAEAAEAGARTVRNEVAGDLRSLHAAVARALRAARVLREDLLPRSEIVLRAAEARYAAGEARLLETLEARRVDARFRLTYLEALRDVLEAWSRLSTFIEA